MTIGYRAITVLSALAMTASLWLHWVSVRGAYERTLTGLDLAGFRWVVLALCAVCVVLSLGWAVTGHPATQRALLPTTATAIALGVGFLVLVEGLPAAIPHALVPKTIRRYSLDVGAGAGPWLFAVAGLVLLLSSRLNGALQPRTADRLLVALLSALVGLDGALACLRVQPWVTGDVAGQAFSVEGRALPYVGPITVGVCLLVAVGVAGHLLRGSAWPLLVSAAACWVGGATTALTLAPVAAARSLRIPGLPAHLTSVSSTAAVWLWAAVCFATAGAVTGLIVVSGGAKR
jgi:hypothetical protein